MKRLFLLLLLFVAGATISFAQGYDSATYSFKSSSARPLSERKPVTNKWSIVQGSASFANHYISNLEYTGEIFGLEAKHGRFYKKSNRLSWQLTLTHLRRMHRPMLGGGLQNFAETSKISTQSYEADYAVYYNWLFCDRLQLRLGGSFNVNGGFIFNATNAMNNVISLDLQTLFLANAQVRYGWDLDRCGLDIYSNIATPFLGVMSADTRFESFFDSLVGGAGFYAKEGKHWYLAAPHNLQGVNFELGVDFAVRNYTWTLSFETRNRWWHANELQNYRKYSLVKMGVSVNLFAQQKYKASERHF